MLSGVRVWEHPLNHSKSRFVTRSILLAALLILGWQVADSSSYTVSSSLAGIYTGNVKLRLTAEGDLTTPAPLTLEVKLTMTETDDGLVGELSARPPNWLITFSLPITGTNTENTVRLKVKVTLCLETPSVWVSLRVTPDGHLLIGKSTQTLNCNFSAWQLDLLDEVKLTR